MSLYEKHNLPGYTDGGYGYLNSPFRNNYAKQTENKLESLIEPDDKITDEPLIKSE